MKTVGQPTKYNEKMIDKIEEYISLTGKVNHTLPTRIGYARFVGVHRDTVQEWEKANPEFKQALSVLDDVQKDQLMNDGLYCKDANATMAIFLLKVNHDMIEKSALDLTSQGDKIAPMVVLDTKKE